MIFTTTIIDECNRNKYFRSEVEANDFTLAIQRVTFDMITVYEDANRREPHTLIIVLTPRDFDIGTKAWLLNCATKEFTPCDVPCAECFGYGGVDSGGVDPQGAPMMTSCPSCSGESKSQSPQDVRGKLNDWCKGIDNGDGRPTGCSCDCPVCKEGAEAKIVLEAWQEAFGTNQLTHALAENQAYGKHLTSFQNEVWASLNRYSDALGWGLSGMQPECWTCLDSAVDELVAKRKLVKDIRDIIGLTDRNTDQMVLDGLRAFIESKSK